MRKDKDTNTMLLGDRDDKLSDKDFKRAIIQVLSQIITNMLETNERTENFTKQI